MKNTKRIVTGMLLGATLALSLMASGSDAYAKSKSAPDRTFTTNGDITITIRPSTDEGGFRALGITWE
jgi:hypothetical protein